MVTAEAWALAVKMHELYERNAITMGYVIHGTTAQFNDSTPNGKLMLAVCTELLVDQSEATKPFVSHKPENSIHKPQWLPLSEAPHDNEEPIILGSFDEYGEMCDIDFDGLWDGENWVSPYGICDPTHWIYQNYIAPPTMGTTH